MLSDHPKTVKVCALKEKKMAEKAWIESIVAIVIDNVPARALCLIVTEYSREFLGVPYQASQFCIKSELRQQVTPISVGNRLVVPEGASLFVWNVRRDECLLELRGHTELVTTIHGNDTQIVSGARDSAARVWDIHTGRCIFVLPHPDWLTAVVCIKPGTIATACYEEPVRIWCDGECIRMLDYRLLESLVLLSNQQVAFVPFCGPIHIWGDAFESSIDMLSGTLYSTVALQAPAGALATINKGDILIGRDHANAILIPKNCESLCSLARGLLASGGIDGEVCIWNAYTGDLVQRLTGHADSVHLLAAMPNNKLASASWDKTVRVWDLTSGRCAHVFETKNDLQDLVALDFGLVAFDNTGEKSVWI